MGFARNLILFLFEREHEGYKRFVDCTVYNTNSKLQSKNPTKITTFEHFHNIDL